MFSTNRRAALSYAARQLIPHKWKIIANIANIIIRSMLFLTPPVMIKYILEWVLPQRDWNLLIIVCCCVILAPIAGSIMIACETYLSRFLYRLYGDGQGELYQRVQHRSMAWFQRTRTGDLITRMLDDTRTLYPFVDGTFSFMLVLAITIIIGAVLLLAYHLVLGMAIVLLWGIHSLIIAKYGDAVKRRTAAIQRQTSNVTETARELLSGARWITMSGQEDKAMRTLNACLHEEWKLARRSQLAENMLQFIDALLHACCLVIMYYYGGLLVMDGDMTLASLISFIAIYTWLRPFGVSLYHMTISVKKTSPSIDRIIDIAAAVPSKEGIRPEDRLNTIEIEDVGLQHGGRIILQEINLHLTAPSVISIVGQRGSGKSTLADLLLRLQAPTCGRIRINGIPLDKLDEGWIRRHLLSVTQDVYLRSGTLMENITFGCDNIDPAALQQAISIAELQDWIDRLPQGLQTEVGQQGMSVSGGERQRISIARALLRQPSLLIMDEATSALDTVTEQRLLANLINRLPHTTFIFITHRMAAAKLSHRTYIMRNGALTEAKQQ